MMPRWPEAMAAAARAMVDATGCSILDALVVLSDLAAEADTPEQAERVRAAEYLIRTTRLTPEPS